MGGRAHGRTHARVEAHHSYVPSQIRRWGEWIYYFLRMQSLYWRHNDHGGVSNRQPHGCLLNRLFQTQIKENIKLRVTGLCVGNSPGPVNSPHKGPVTRKMFPFDDVIMIRMSPLNFVVGENEHITTLECNACKVCCVWIMQKPPCENDQGTHLVTPFE